MKKRKIGKAVTAAKSAKTLNGARVGRKEADLETLFDELKGILSAYAPPFRATAGRVREKRDYHLTIPTPVVIPGRMEGSRRWRLPADSAKGICGVLLHAGGYGARSKKKLEPQLVKLLKGESRFCVNAGTARVGGGDWDGMFSRTGLGVRRGQFSVLS